MKKGDRFKKEHTLCWDCGRATDDICPWVDAGMPVPGWWASPSKIKTCGVYSDSYRVIKCPMFVRDADKAGVVKVPLKGEKRGGFSNHSKHRPHDAWDRVVVSRRPVGVDNGGGSVASKRGRKTWRVERNTLDLAFGIIERAVIDWRALDYGRLAEVMVDGELVSRKDTCEFFFSDWFIDLCNVTQFTPEQIRGFLHIPEDAMEIIQTADARRRFIDADFQSPV